MGRWWHIKQAVITLFISILVVMSTQDSWRPVVMTLAKKLSTALRISEGQAHGGLLALSVIALMGLCTGVHLWRIRRLIRIEERVRRGEIKRWRTKIGPFLFWLVVLLGLAPTCLMLSVLVFEPELVVLEGEKRDLRDKEMNWKLLHDQAVDYSQGGHYEGAITIEKHALSVAEAIGSEHPYVVTSLDYLSVLCEKMGRHTEATDYRKRADKIRYKDR